MGASKWTRVLHVLFVPWFRGREFPEGLVTPDKNGITGNAGSAEDGLSELEFAHYFSFLTTQVHDLGKSLLIEEVEVIVITGNRRSGEGALDPDAPEALTRRAIGSGENPGAVDEEIPVARNKRAAGGRFLRFLAPEGDGLASLVVWS